MALVPLLDLPASGPLIGIDPGRKGLGIAASDALRLIATPVETIPRGRKLAPTLDRLMELVTARGTAGIVMGLPLNMDGSEGPSAQSAKALVRSILGRIDLPIALQDERLTTAQAERDMIAADMRREDRAARIDASAAAIILQTALDRLANADGGD